MTMRLGMLHSEIEASINFYKNVFLVPGIDITTVHWNVVSHKTQHIDILLEILNLEGHQIWCISSKVTAILLNGGILPIGGVALGRVCPCSLCGRLVFSNPREKVLGPRGQICPIGFLLVRTFFPGLENNNTFKWWSNNFPSTLMYAGLLENCQNNFSMYHCSPKSW